MPASTEAERLEAADAAIERELTRRREAKWKAGEWTIPMQIVDRGETVSAANPLIPWGRDYPPELIELHIVNPAPTVETHPYAPDHADARDVTPPPYRPPMPPSSARSLPPAPGAGALSVDPARMNIPARIHDAEQRRTRNFNDDTWGDPSDWPIRYPRGNRSGW